MANENRKRTTLTLEAVAEQARETTLRFGYHVPTLIVEDGLQTLFTQIEKMAEAHEARLVQMYVRGIMIARTGVVGVLQQAFFISEAWMSTGTSSDTGFIPPSKHPQRKEVLIVARYAVRSVTQDGVVFEMKRDRSGRLAGMEEQDVGQDVSGSAFRSPLMEAFVAGLLGSLPGANEQSH
ncbi:MAG: hypothetical protein IPK19_28025 [Chloroflexi bacterium]|nr:hypothetical protein [Chloroflexota bacterium]